MGKRSSVTKNLDLIRFWGLVEARGLFDCWPWSGAINGSGYGTYGGRMAHRVAYFAFAGEVSAGHQLDHICRNRWCVNPAHLEAVTPTENRRRGDAVQPRGYGRGGSCHRGHLLSGENLYRVLDRDGRWRNKCRTCRAGYRERSLAELRALRAQGILGGVPPGNATVGG